MQIRITALPIFYGQPVRRRELTFKMIRDLCEKLKTERPRIAQLNVWRDFEELGEISGAVKTELTALVLHNIGDINSESFISPTDALISNDGKPFDYVLANPPFGKKAVRLLPTKRANRKRKI